MPSLSLSLLSLSLTTAPLAFDKNPVRNVRGSNIHLARTIYAIYTHVSTQATTAEPYDENFGEKKAHSHLGDSDKRIICRYQNDIESAKSIFIMFMKEFSI